MSDTDLIERTTIATTTFYNPDSEFDTIRMDLAKKAIREATSLGYKVVVVDKSSPNKFLEAIEKYGAIIIEDEGFTMGESRRQTIGRASTFGQFVAWMEPEKYPYVPELIKTVRPIAEGEADIVIPRRQPSSLDSYPTSQRFAEQYGNQCWLETTGLDLDIWSGPRTMNRDATKYFLNYNGKQGDLWESIFIPILNAHHAGRRVLSVNVDYIHPLEQSEFEEGNSIASARRLRQLNNLIPAFREAHQEYLDYLATT